MLRLLSDENFNGDIVRGLFLRSIETNVVRVQDVGLGGAVDPSVLAWAAEHDRIVLTHERTTMPKFAYARVTAGEVMPGVFVMDDRAPAGQWIRELQLMIACSEQAEWSNLVVYLPL